MFKYILIVISLLLAVPVYAAESVSFLAFADIHFDPFIACKKIATRPCPLAKKLQAAPVSEWKQILSSDAVALAYRQDTTSVLLQSALSEAKLAVSQHPVNFVLVLGDTLGHDFRYYYRKYLNDNSRAKYIEFAAKTLEFVNSEFAETFPKTNVFMVTGNNDTFSRNYQSVPSGPFFHDMSKYWSSLVHDPQARTVMQREFAQAGYYAVDIPGHSELKLIVLNTVLFSYKAEGEGAAQAAEQQLQWLHKILEQAKVNQQKVMIAMHIPPELDLYLLSRWQLMSVTTFWRPHFIIQFKRELANFYPQIAGIFTGHLHYEWSQPFWVNDSQRLPVVTVPSISPIFGNDPSFKLYEAGGVYTFTYPVYGSSWHADYVRELL